MLPFTVFVMLEYITTGYILSFVRRYILLIP
jgi:hypothetical protein